MSGDSISNNDRAWVVAAADHAEKNADDGNFRLGAIVVKGGSVLGVGANRHRNYGSYDVSVLLPTIPKEAWSVHAEIAALKAADRSDLRGATIYVARVNKSTEYRPARPCPACESAILKSGIKRIVYTTMDSVSAERTRHLSAVA